MCSVCSSCQLSPIFQLSFESLLTLLVQYRVCSSSTASDSCSSSKTGCRAGNVLYTRYPLPLCARLQLSHSTDVATRIFMYRTGTVYPRRCVQRLVHASHEESATTRSVDKGFATNIRFFSCRIIWSLLPPSVHPACNAVRHHLRNNAATRNKYVVVGLGGATIRMGVRLDSPVLKTLPQGSVSKLMCRQCSSVRSGALSCSTTAFTPHEPRVDCADESEDLDRSRIFPPVSDSDPETERQLLHHEELGVFTVVHKIEHSAACLTYTQLYRRTDS